uniref:Lysosomal aspartic protease n=1 Tax=Aceria tosichella TaxID=561515 RepID=A0A6G1SNE1_9ACAR
MFKFKMLTKVLVAVFFYGQIIELNLNLCIALSIDLSSPTHQIEPNKAGSLSIEHNAELEMQGRADVDDQSGVMSEAAFASRTLQSASTSNYMATTTTTTTNTKTKTTTNNTAASNSSPTAGDSSSSSQFTIQVPPKGDTMVKDDVQQHQQQQQQDQQLQNNQPIKVALVQKLQSNGRVNYFGEIRVGQQQVPFLVLFDLLSTNFWLPSSECKSNACLGRQKYARAESDTYEAGDETGYRMEVNDSRGLVLEGPISRDSVTFAGVTIDRQPFGEVTRLEGDLLGTMPVDGFMGLGFKEFRFSNSKEVAASDSVTKTGNTTTTTMDLLDDDDTLDDELTAAPMTPIETLWSMGLLKEPIFSLKLKADIEEYKSSIDNGELILGEISEEYSPEEFTYVPVTHVDYWEFHLSSVSLRSSYGARDLEQGCQSVCPAILDTRFSFIAGHFSDVDRLNRAMGAYPIGNGIYRMSQCDLGLLPYLVFKIGGNEFLLAPDEYVNVRRIRGMVHSCYSNLVVVDSQVYPFWILGETFLKRHYMVFDYGQKRIGFARSKTMSQEVVEDEYGRIKKVRGTRMIMDVL